MESERERIAATCVGEHIIISTHSKKKEGKTNGYGTEMTSSHQTHFTNVPDLNYLYITGDHSKFDYSYMSYEENGRIHV